MFPRKKGRLQLFEDSYLCEANIEAAKIIIDREWKKAEKIKDHGGRALYLGLTCLRASSVLEYFNIIFHTHGGF